MESEISVSFILTGDEFSKEDIGEKLKLEPSYFRTRKDWPKAVLNWPVYYPDLPDKYKPRTVWCLKTGYEECMSAGHQLEKMLKILEGKEETIHRLCKEFGLRAGFVIGITADMVNFSEIRFPEVHLERKAVAFMDKAGADVSFYFQSYTRSVQMEELNG